MLSKEEKEKRDKLVKERPCKECIHYRKDSYILCGNKCDFMHGGFVRSKKPKSDI